MFRFSYCLKNLAGALAVVAGVASAPNAQATDLLVTDDAVRDKQWQDFLTDRSRSMREFQPFRTSVQAVSADGAEVTLTSLNPKANTWFLVDVLDPSRSRQTVTYHLELADPEKTVLTLARGDDPALVFESDGIVARCTPWQGRTPELARAAGSDLPYAPICDNRAFVRNATRGARSSREAVSQFLRDNVVFGDDIVNLIKGSFYEDAYMSSGEVIAGGDAGEVAAALGKANLSSHPVIRTYFGFELEGAEGGVQAGSWYAVKDAPGVYASAMQPGMISPDILNRRGETHGLDGVERRADVYLVAFDLTQFEVGYEAGTDHPRLGWSSRPPGAARVRGLSGPDGFNTSDPIVRTGMLSPSLTERVAAAFTGGYKRDHGAWRAGDMAYSNKGHHYGFLSKGVIFSRLYPGLSTLFVLDDGSIQMRKWREADNALLERVRFARQNGVPLINDGVPGDQVVSWLGGNWSGSAEADLRTLRGGACMKTVNGRQFLIYAYFSTATPSAMARTFQAYGCDHAMLLDMNSQDLTYMALYTREDRNVIPHHLVRGMAETDSRGRDGTPIPRFVSFADNRDFFYLLRK
ncbi:hypothetical protein [Roseovarius amoyensis]|uniref:hypothetical protein n=1 Tax=Roseovarius amoyensis TaxID=2211448 RepID=UPI001EF96926|nr:hypothetical protein [Roseovarius amoyensis]